MSAFNIKFSQGHKTMHLVKSREEYIRLRNSSKQIALVAEARKGNSDAKSKLEQMNYSCLPAEGGLLKGAKEQSNSVGMDIDFKLDPNSAEYKQLMEELPKKVIALKDELGLLMLERSVTKGFHVVFRRNYNMSQVENLKWASKLIGVDYDDRAKDITRVFYTTTASEEDLLYLDDALFTPAPAAAAAASAPSASSVPSASFPSQPPCSGVKPAVSPCSLSQPQAGEGYLGFTWQQIIAKYFDLFNNGKEPKAGNRNTLTFELAQALSPLVDYNLDSLLAIVPRYDSLPEQEWRTTLASAAQHRWKTMPRRTRQVLQALKDEALKNLLGGSPAHPERHAKEAPSGAETAHGQGAAALQALRGRRRLSRSRSSPPRSEVPLHRQFRARGCHHVSAHSPDGDRKKQRQHAYKENYG